MIKHLKPLSRNLSFRLFLIVLSVYFFGDFLNDTVKSGLYAISLSLKAILLFVLPVIIFSCLFSCMLAFKDRALIFIVSLFAALSLSNLLSTFVAYIAGHQVLSLIRLRPQEMSASGNKALMSLWSFTLPKIPNEYALLLGGVLGVMFSFYHYPDVENLADKLKGFVTFFLQKMFIPVLPLFALGFIIKMHHDKLLSHIIHSYTSILGIILCTYIIYLALLFGVCAGFRLNRWSDYVRNVIPASFMGFSTMSSMAALPLTLRAAELNTQNPMIARAVVPVTVNIHLIGDSIGIPILAMAIMLTFGQELPTFNQYLMFAVFFVLNKFAVAGVPGGGIIVMIPILEAYLGFTHEMSVLITALYILFDPVITAINVAGNSAFAILFSKCFKKPLRFKS